MTFAHALTEIQVQAQRQVIGKPFTFSDGLTLPAGTRLAFPTAGQHDLDVSKAAEDFDGFRHVQREDVDKDWSAVHPSSSYLA